MKGVNSRVIGNKYVEIVKNYIEQVNLKDVPKNQYGNANRNRILCEILGLKKHARYNEKVQLLLDSLDRKLCKNPLSAYRKYQSENQQEILKAHINKLQSSNAALMSENEYLKQKEISINWFIEKGRMLKP